MFIKFLPFFHRLKHRIVFSVATFFKTDENQELLKTIDTHLLIWNHELVNLETMERAVLSNMNAETIASVAKEITVKKDENKQNSHIALYLSNVEFVSTEYVLPEMAAQNIASALRYQVNELMPAYPGELMLAVNHDESRDKNIALWLDYNRTESLSCAFKAQNIELTAIIPRVILASLVKNETATKNQIRQFREHDDDNLLQITLNNQKLIQWSSISNIDISDEAFFQEWEKRSELLNDFTHIDSADFWSAFDRTSIAQIAYAFFPESVRRNLKKHSRLKKGRLSAIAGIIAIAFLTAPFINNKIRYIKYEQRYQEYQEKTAEVRKMRASVNQFEENWALFFEHPKIDATAILNKLNMIIPKNSWISVFELKDSELEIEGNSPNAAGILEVISKQAEFEQVAFNQRTRSDRGRSEHFGISFRLKNNNMDAYRKKFYRNSNTRMSLKEKKLLFVFLTILMIGIIAKGIPFAIKSYKSGVEAVEVLKDKRKRLKKLLARSDYWKIEYDKTKIKEQQLEKLLYVGQSPDLMAGRVQSTLKTLTKNSQIKVDSMSLPDLKQYNDWLLITQSMTFKTNSNSLMKLLQLIKKAKPQLIVNELEIRSQRTTLICTIKIVAFSRLKQEESGKKEIFNGT